MKKLLLSLLFSSCAFMASLAFGASFDCSKASTPTEKTVCASPTLSVLDDELGAAYVKARATSSNPDQLKSDQIAWIKNVQGCNANEPCMTALYKERIAQLSPTSTGLPAPVSPVANQAQSTPNAQQADDTKQPIAEPTPQQSNVAATNLNSEPSPQGGDASLLAYMVLAAIVSAVLTPLVLVVSCAIVRKSVPKGNGNAFVRNLGSTSSFATLFTFWLAILVTLFSLPDETSPISFGGIVFALILFAIGLLTARVFAVEEAGLAYDAQKGIIEITAAYSEADSLMDYFKPTYWFRSMRRVQLPVSSIKSLGGWSNSQTTTTYDPKTNKVSSNTSVTHILNLATTEGQWSIRFSSSQKRDAAHTLICELAGLE